MRIIAGLLIVVMLWFPQLALAGDDGRINRALLVGVDAFETRENTAPSAANNVQHIAQALQAGMLQFASITIPDNPVASVKTLRDWIHAAFADADADDVNYLYVATHGDHDSAGNAALLLSDGQRDNLLTAQALESLFDGIQGTIIILLDACYSGAFIGKGMPVQPPDVHFHSGRFKILTSSGAMEESWYWNGQNDYMQGSFYFTQILIQGISPDWNYPADQNRDGAVTLSELYRYVLENHGASTPQLYPQEDTTVIFTYDIQAGIPQDRAPIVDVVFSDDVMRPDDTLTLSFTAIRPVRVAYQIVYFRDGQWQFDEAELLYDQAERFTAFGDLAGAVMPGRKVRDITLAQSGETLYGYVLVQVLALEDDVLTMQTGHVITVTPDTGNLLLQVKTPQNFQANEYAELPIFVRHSLPCSLSVSVINQDDETVRRLSYRGPTRPLGIRPEGSCYYWNGRGRDGELVPEGKYHVRVEAWIGDTEITAVGDDITITR